MDLSQRLDEMELAIHKPSFRKGTGRANEVNYWVFDYPPEKELEVRERVEYLKNKNDRGDDDFELVVFDLYDIIIDFLEKKNFMEKCYDFEKKRGIERIVKAVTNSMKVNDDDSLIVQYIKEHTPENAVVFLTGIGKCYPILRSHKVLNNLHQELVENIYTNEYLACLLPAWNAGIQQDAAFSAIPLQREFYNANLRYTKERTVVIISDAMRYEVGQELFARMQDDPKCTAKLSVQLSVLPSYTRLGMAALLPHKTLEMTDDFQVLADGILCDNLAGRQQVLQSYNPDSVCVQFDDIKNLKVAELRDVLTKRQIIYVYHNQIDARGDKANTEDEVFNACEEAVQEIVDLIHRISVSGNTYHFIVTADHGFIYKRDKLTESDKISGKSADKAFVNRRFIVSKATLEDDGIDHMSMGRILGNEDSKVVSYPVSSNVFKVAGGGANYVHGGSSPQEMLVPVLEFKMERGHMETKNAEIALVSIVHKITNLITSMDFIQSDAVSDTVKAAKYRIFFLSEDNEKISNENSYVADSREENAQKRIFRMRFTFKNKKYDKDKQYYLVVYDEESGLEQWRQPVIMDIAFADDFGFGF